jgi:porin
VESAAEFLNNGVTYTPTLPGVPSYPDTAWSIGLYALPTEQSWLSLALFDGAAQEGVNTGNHGVSSFLGEAGRDFAIAEAGRAWPAEGALPEGRAALGAWHHNGDFDRFDGGTQSGASGIYALFEQGLWREAPGDAGDEQGLDAFLQAGTADADVSDVARHLAAGLAWTGALPGRDADVAGLAATTVAFTDEPGAGYTADHELVLEAFYGVQLREWLSVKPDLQWIADPGGDGSAADAWVFTLRFAVEL